MSIEEKLCKVKIFQLLCDKMYLSKVCVQEFWYIKSGFDIQPEQSLNNNLACKKRFQVASF